VSPPVPAGATLAGGLLAGYTAATGWAAAAGWAAAGGAVAAGWLAAAAGDAGGAGAALGAPLSRPESSSLQPGPINKESARAAISPKDFWFIVLSDLHHGCSRSIRNSRTVVR
jgi:hypothetical protein